jgi:hypothetical protein
MTGCDRASERINLQVLVQCPHIQRVEALDMSLNLVESSVRPNAQVSTSLRNSCILNKNRTHPCAKVT